MALHWPGDPTMNVNMSVWESPETLGRFVFQTVHRNIYARKHDFFEAPERPTFVLWWVELRAHPDAGSQGAPRPLSRAWAQRRRLRLRRPQARAWMERRCA